MTPTAENSRLPAVTALPEPEPRTATLDPWADPATVAVTKDGRVIKQVDEDDLDAEIILKYQAMAAKAFRQKKGGDREIVIPQFVTASQWMMMQLFTVDGQPLAINHLSGKPSTNPQCLGLMVIAKLSVIATNLISEIPQGKD